MPGSYHQWKNLQDAERLLEIVEGPRLIWIHRPILLHDRSEDGELCDCGCNSRRAKARAPVDHIDVLISTISGLRLVQRPDDPDEWKAEFAELAKKAHRIDCPVRCYEKQLPYILDRTHKVLAFFGGARGGKTSAMVERALDSILLLGGRGAQFWWVAPTREKTQIGVRKFVTGEKTDRRVNGVIPPELVLSYPKDERAGDQAIRLIDGTVIFLKYGGRKGGNLKGDPAQEIWVDELCELDHEANWQICLDRLTDAGGQLCSATTPIAGHWAKVEVFEAGKDFTTARKIEARGDPVDVIAETATAFENPWQDPKEIERRIRAGGGRDNPKVRREVFGEWVGEGPIMWSHFFTKPKVERIGGKEYRICHLISGPWRDVSGWGLVNVSTLAVGHFFDGSVKQWGGQDFNFWPMSLTVLQVGCPAGMNQQDPKNWVLVAIDEFTKKGTIFEFSKFLVEKAGLYRKQKAEHFAGLKISCDATGAQYNPPAVHGMTDRGATLAKVMNEHGFDCRPCFHHPGTGNPTNPGKVDQVSLLHSLMQSRVEAPQGEVYPRLLVHADRCPKLVHSLTTQESTDKGIPIKESGTATDRLSGPTDSLIYGAWPAFADHEVFADGPSIQW